MDEIIIGKDCKEDIKILNTPCYILDVPHLDNNILDLQRGFRDKWGKEVVFGYSVKTNSLPWLITHMKEKGFLAEVVSEQEYRLALALGFEADEIIFNGPVKSEEMMVSALNKGSIVNIDNNTEIDILEANTPEDGREWNIGLRFSFDIEGDCPGETIVGDAQSRFGFRVENGELKRAIERIDRIRDVKITGLHGHSSTRTKSLNIFGAIARRAAMIKDQYGLKLGYLDIGGGFFGDKPGAPSFEEYGETISRAFGDHAGIKLIVEPGASLVSSPISYLSSVYNTREVVGKSFVTLDGSCIHTDPLMHGINLSKKIYLFGEDDKRDIVSEQELCGFTCIEMDRMGRILQQTELKPGDRVEFVNCGSYSMTLSPLFISYYPSVYAFKDNEYKLIRHPWGEREFMAKCEVS